MLLSKGFSADATSEAYCAMFYAAKAMLLSAGSRATRHKHVEREFQDLFVRSHQVKPRFGQSLKDGYKLRHLADYETDLAATISSKEAEGSLKEAREFVEMAGAFLKAGEG